MLIDDLDKRGIYLPILVRFTDILKSRIRTLATSFHNAIKHYDYTGATAACTRSRSTSSGTSSRSSCEFSEPFHMGLEAGSKPELLVVLALTGRLPRPSSSATATRTRSTSRPR